MGERTGPWSLLLGQSDSFSATESGGGSGLGLSTGGDSLDEASSEVTQSPSPWSISGRQLDTARMLQSGGGSGSGLPDTVISIETSSWPWDSGGGSGNFGTEDKPEGDLQMGALSA